MAVKILKLRRPDACTRCSTSLSIGDEASWDSAAKTVTCMACSTGAPPAVEALNSEAFDSGRAGASAAREYERRSARERSRKEAAVEKDAQWRQEVTKARPIVGRLATAITPKPVIGPESQSTAAWKVGAEGEERVAEILDACAGVRALHDRRVPGSKANIDHLAVGPGGVYVIDAKKYTGAVERRDRGSWLRTDLRLYVGGRDRSKLVDGVERQLETVGIALRDTGLADAIPVHGILCFVGATWPLMFRKPLTFGRVTAVWPLGLEEIVRGRGPLTPEGVDHVAAVLAGALKPA